MMTPESLLAEISENPSLPTLPAVALQVIERANRPDCSVSDLAKIICHDPGLTGKILKIVNSALFGLSQPVTVIHHALQLLGIRRVRALVLSLSLPALKSKMVPGPQMQAHWKVSVVGAIAALNLARRTNDPDPDGAMVAALLRDLGIIVLHQMYPEEYERLLSVPSQVLLHEQCRLEREEFGVDHAQISAHLLKRWHLPEEIYEPVRYHHALETPPLPPAVAPRVRLVQFASQVAQMERTSSSPSLLTQILHLASDWFGMTEDELGRFLEPLNQQIDEMAALMEIDIGVCKNYAALIASATEQLSKWTVEVQLDNLRLQEEKSRAVKGRLAAEDALRRTEEQLRQAQKMEALGRLAGGVAHDFNNLLTIITGYAELALGSVTADNPLHCFLQEIHNASSRATALTRQLLAFSRKQVLSLKSFSLNTTITEMEKMLRRLIGEDIELVTRLSPDLLPVLADPAQIDQVLLNLAVNARDAMPHGGKLIIETANVDADEEFVATRPGLRPGKYVLLSISDTGHGMDAETQKHIFEPFFTTKEPGKGTGLGLATVYGIVKQTEGYISVESQPSCGTTFRIYLPPAADEPADTSAFPEELFSGGSETILVVEDEDTVREMVTQILQSCGYRVMEAAHGVDAYDIALRHTGPIHLLLTDLVMPQISGHELATRLLHVRPEIRVLYMTGYADDTIVCHGLTDAESSFLRKPFTPRKLVSMVRHALEAEVPVG